MKNEQFNRFLVSHLARVEPLSREARLAYWDATISGRKEDFDRYAALEVDYNKLHADKAAFERLRGWREAGAVVDPLEKRQLDILYRQFLRNQIPADLIEKIGRLSSEISNKFIVYRTTVDGQQLTGNDVRAALRDSTDSAYRRRVWEADKGVGAVVRADLMELIALRNRAAAAVGFEDHYTMSLRLSEQDPDNIISLFDELDERTREPFAELKSEIDEILSDRYGVPADQLMPWHYHDPFFQEAPSVLEVDLDRYYDGHDVVELVASFFDGIGLEVRDILARSDLYEKPGKEQHAYCMDIDRRGDIRILANVCNDERWAGTLLHELGHAVYDRYVDAGLPFLLREHAHIFATESIAMLFGRLSKDADWIQHATGIADDERDKIKPVLMRGQALAQLVFARWCQVMVRFERALYADPDQDLGQLWWDLVERYQLLTRPEGDRQYDWASKIHVVSHPAYYHNYMLGELLASQLDHVIQTQVLQADGGRVIVNGRREVGDFLVDNVFRPGKRMHWDGLIKAATGEPLTPRYFVGQFLART
jgi:peptidyl-dipeptidase A